LCESLWPKHIAAVLLPEQEGFRIARTYPEVEGHHTVWGDPERLIANVERVVTHSEPDLVKRNFADVNGPRHAPEKTGDRNAWIVRTRSVQEPRAAVSQFVGDRGC
jgi:hypothetical protein